MNYLIQDDKVDRFLSFSIVFQLVLLGCKNVLVQGVPFLYDINETLNIIILGASVFLYTVSFFLSKSRPIRGGFFFFAFFIAFSFFATFLFFPENAEYLNKYILRTLICCLFTGFLISKLKSLFWLSRYMLKGSYLILLSAILFAAEIILIGHTTTSEWGSYSMSMSNVVMLAVMWQLHAFFKQNNKFALLCSIIGFIIIFFYGSRNPILAIALYIVIELFDSLKERGSAIHKLLFSLFIFSSIIFLIFRKQILLIIARFLESLGFLSRTLYLLISDNGEDFSTGRDDIHEQIWKVIWDNPLFGSGIAGDEVNIKEMAHSLYLSILCTYGIFIGSFFVLFLLIKCYSAHKQSIGLDHQILVLFICLVFPRGFTGGDIWQSDVFWWMMGVVFYILTQKKKSNESPTVNCS